MREVRVEIDENGRVRILYQGFQGGACFEEAKRLYTLLKAQGLDVSIEQVVPTQEYYVSNTSQRAKEVLTNGR
jgi:arylamine N-acetyltransferase